MLKVPHHGIRTSSSYEFLNVLQPEAAVITAYGYSQYGAYEYLKSIGTGIYSTGSCNCPAIVEFVMDDSYEIRSAGELTQSAEEGWHSWLDHYYYVENGRPPGYLADHQRNRILFRPGWYHAGIML